MIGLEPQDFVQLNFAAFIPDKTLQKIRLRSKFSL